MGKRPFLSHRAAGDGIQPSAADHNAIVDSTLFVRKHLMKRLGMGKANQLPVPSFVNMPLLVKNNTASLLTAFQIVKLGAPAADPSVNLNRFKWNLILGGSAPGDNDPVMAVTMERIAPGSVGKVMLNGLTPLQVDLQNSTDNVVQTIDGDVTKATSAVGSGAGRILWKETGTGVKWCLVMIPSIYVPMKMLVRFTADVAFTNATASFDATITDQYGPGDDHGETSITVTNSLTHTAGTYFYQGDLGDAGLAIWNSASNFICIDMECP